MPEGAAEQIARLDMGTIIENSKSVGPSIALSVMLVDALVARLPFGARHFIGDQRLFGRVRRSLDRSVRKLHFRAVCRNRVHPPRRGL
jgi:hypothetical protein